MLERKVKFSKKRIKVLVLGFIDINFGERLEDLKCKIFYFLRFKRRFNWGFKRESFYFLFEKLIERKEME